MRIQRIDLVRYGKFTDKKVEFPAAKRDFHMVIGPNEAGKSTLRSAIQELLYGIHRNSPLDFRHAKSDLRLGGRIEHLGESLAFQRVKGNKQTIRDTKDVPLQDSVLSPFLGSTDQSFFDNMFGLDHFRLVEGGKSILDASDDVGQVLFQSSAGIASLGKIRDTLEREADSLWAPKKSGDRAYYKALDQLDKATGALKGATVRTKDWLEAYRETERLNDLMEAERKRHSELQGRRGTLERVRRLAPILQELRENERQLAELGVVIELPADANIIQDSAESELSTAQEILRLRTEEVARLNSEASVIRVDEDVLQIEHEIAALEEMRVKFSSHERDIEIRANEVTLAWQEALDAMIQLGWGELDEDAVRRRIPTLTRRKAIMQLVKEHGGLAEIARAARQAERVKRAETDALNTQLAKSPTTDVPPALRVALTGVQQLGDVEATRSRHETTVSTAKAATAIAFQALGMWSKSLADLRLMQIPSQQTIDTLVRDRQTLLADQRAIQARVDEQALKIRQAALAVRQYDDAHHPITREEVAEARELRDTAWIFIKTGSKSIEEGAAAVDDGIRRADELADARIGKVEQEAEFQSRRQQLEREKLDEMSLEEQKKGVDGRLEVFDAEWAARMNAASLPGMPLETLSGWVADRVSALAAASAEEKATADAHQFEETVRRAATTLLAALRIAGAEVSDSSELPALVLQAQGLIQDADATVVKRETLSNQLNSALPLLEPLEQAAKDAADALTQWRRSWVDALNAAGLGPESDIGLAEGALDLIARVEDKIGKMREIRVERIDAMKADLQSFETAAQRLCKSSAPDLRSQSAAAVAIALMRRLNRAREDKKERERVRDALLVANNNVVSTNETILKAKARMEPLHARAGTTSSEALAEAIARSHGKRSLSGEIAKLGKRLIESGDGFSRGELEADIDAANLTQLTVELADVDQNLKDSLGKQTELSANIANAETALGKIVGSHVAAQAEADRQLALAAMADAAERYIKVATAASLLRWSIDQYRDKRQGPMLARAGTLFSQLTLGSFQRLILDYEQQPPSLEGQRADGQLVGISGLSAGTRDQLYLSLRLAALELHLEQAHAMPFIADDLFINFDDARSEAGIQALAGLSEKTQVLFFSHHDHLVERVRNVLGAEVNIVAL